MGILSLLRNAFSRSRKGRDTVPSQESERVSLQDAEPVSAPEAEPVSSPAAEPKVPAPAAEPEPTAAAAEPTAPVTVPTPASSVVDELVSAAFDNVTVPKPRSEETEQKPEPEAPATETAAPATEAAAPVTEAADEPTAAAEPEVEAAAPVVEPEPEAVVEPEPAVKAEAEAETEAVTETEPEPVVEQNPEPTAPVAEAEVVAEAEPEPVAANEPEPTVEPDPQPEPVVEETPEPAAAADPEPVVEPDPQPEAVKAPEPDTAPEPEPEQEPEPELEAAPEPEPVATPAPEPESAPETAPEPVAAAVDTPEPAVADGDVAPQESPALDDESGTGAAGGNEEAAEGEAEAVTPATPATRIRTRAPGLTTAYKAAATTLKKHNLTGARATVYLVLDRSASMRSYYKDGSAQALGEQTLALAAHLDPEAEVHVVFFSTELDGTSRLTLAEHENKIDELHEGLGRMGRTSYHVAVEEVLTQHQKSADPTTPALVVFQTDGAPDAKTPATQALTDAAKNHPTVHFAFVAFGDPENKAFDYLRKLKTDNTSFFHAGPTPRELTDTELYEGVLANWRP